MQTNAVSVGTVGLMFDDAEVLSGDVFALQTLPPEDYDYYSYPTLHSGHDTTNCFDPTARPDNKNKTTTRSN